MSAAIPPRSDETETLIEKSSEIRSNNNVRICDNYWEALETLLAWTAVSLILLFSLNFLVCLPSRGPTFQVHNVSVSNFTVSAATWQANLTVTNPNGHNMMRLDDVESVFYYKDTDKILSRTITLKNNHALINPHAKTVVNVATSSIPLESDLAMEIRSWLLEYRTLTFGLKVRAYYWVYNKKLPWLGYGDASELTCEPLKVDFKDGSTGSSVDLPIECVSTYW